MDEKNNEHFTECSRSDRNLNLNLASEREIGGVDSDENVAVVVGESYIRTEREIKKVSETR